MKEKVAGVVDEAGTPKLNGAAPDVPVNGTDDGANALGFDGVSSSS